MVKYLIILMMLLSVAARADDTNTQTNTSGSNTNITGGYESTSTTTYEDGATNTTTTNNDTTATTNNKSTVPPPSANAPSYSAMSQDVCSMGVSGSISSPVIGLSGGKHIVDENCERIKLAKVLQDFGMKVASVAVLCQDSRVHMAMQSAGTPCPFDGKIGKEAQAMWDKYPQLRPDYEEHLARTKIIEKIDAEISAQQLKEEEERLAEEVRLKELKALKEKENEIIVEIIIPPVNNYADIDRE